MLDSDLTQMNPRDVRRRNGQLLLSRMQQMGGQTTEHQLVEDMAAGMPELPVENVRTEVQRFLRAGDFNGFMERNDTSGHYALRFNADTTAAEATTAATTTAAAAMTSRNRRTPRGRPPANRRVAASRSPANRRAARSRSPANRAQPTEEKKSPETKETSPPPVMRRRRAAASTRRKAASTARVTRRRRTRRARQSRRPVKK